MKKIIGKLNLMAIFCIILGLLLSPIPMVSAQEADPDQSYTLHTEGNQLVNAAGEAVRLLGVGVPYLSWSADAYAMQAAEAAVDVALNEWNSNVIRLAVVPKFWLGSTGDSYKKCVDGIIAKVAAAGKYVILDNHSFHLPDNQSEEFWKDAAVRYKDHPHVLFELFNEPAECSWQQYFEGGTLTYSGQNDWGETVDVNIESKGVPHLLKTLRETGASNVVILPGLTWGFDLSYMTETNFRRFASSLAESGNATDKAAFVEDYVDKYFMKETTGNGIMYSTHPYPDRASEWDDYLKDTILEYPVIVGECGPTEKTSGFIRKLSDNDISYLDKLASYMSDNGLHLAAWSIGAWPFLNKEPSLSPSAYGEYMQDFIKREMENKAVKLYEGQDYQGNAVTLETGKYTVSSLKDKGFSLRSLGSLSCKDDLYQYTVILYEKEDYSGASYHVISNSKSLIPDVIGFTPESLVITRGPWVNILPDHVTVEASGEYAGQSADYVADGRNSTFWQNKSENGSTITLKLDSVYALNKITLAHAAEANMLPVFNVSDYTISVSTDGNVYTRIVDVQNNTMGLTSYTFDQVIASYIKIHISKGGLTEPDTAYLAEVMAYGSPYAGEVEKEPASVGSPETPSERGFAGWLLAVLIICGAVLLVCVTTSVILFIRKKTAHSA